jgi:hypothetical protein
MGRSTIGIDIVSDASKSAKGFQQARNNLKGLGADAATANKGFSSGVKQFAAYAAGVLAVTAFAKKALGATVEWGGEVRTLTRELGLGAKEASGLAFAAEHLGIDTETLSKSMGIFAKHLVANDKAAKEYGISLKDANGVTKSATTLLGEAADRILKLPPGLERSAAAMNLFGRGGKALLPLLQLGSKGIKDLAGEAKKFGLELTGENLSAIQRYKFAQRDLGATVKGLEVQFSLHLLPALTSVFHAFGIGVGVLGHVPPAFIAAGAGAILLLGTIGLLGKAVTFVSSGFEQLGLTSLIASARQKILVGDTAAVIAALETEQAVLASTATEQKLLADTGIGNANAFAGVSRFGSALGGVALSALRVVGPIGLAAGALLLYSHNTEKAAKEADAFAQKFAAQFPNAESQKKHIEDQIKVLKGYADQQQAMEGGTIFGEPFVRNLFGAQTASHKTRDEIKALQKQLEQLQQEVPTDPLGALNDSLDASIDKTQTFRAVLKLGAPPDFVDFLKNMGDAGQAAADAISKDPTALSGLVAKWKAGLDSMTADAKAFAGMTAKEFSDWKTSLTSNLNGIGTALDALSGKSKVSAKDILKAFGDQVKATLSFKKNLSALAAEGAPQALVKQIADGGVKYAGVLEAMTHGTEAQRNAIFRLFNDSATAAAGTADSIGKIGASIDHLPLLKMKGFADIIDKLPAEKRIQILSVLQNQGNITPDQFASLLKNLPQSVRVKILALVDAEISAHFATFTGISAVNRLARGGTGHEGGHVTAGGIKRFHSGGSPGADELDARLQLGEFVVRRQAVSAYGLQTLRAMNEMRMPAMAGAGAKPSVTILVDARGAVFRDREDIDYLARRLEQRERRIIRTRGR